MRRLNILSASVITLALAGCLSPRTCAWPTESNQTRNKLAREAGIWVGDLTVCQPSSRSAPRRTSKDTVAPTAADAADRIANSGISDGDEPLSIGTVTVRLGVNPDGTNNIREYAGVQDGVADGQPDGETLDDAQKVTAEAVTEEKREEAIKEATTPKPTDESLRTNGSNEGVDIFG